MKNKLIQWDLSILEWNLGGDNSKFNQRAQRNHKEKPQKHRNFSKNDQKN